MGTISTFTVTNNVEEKCLPSWSETVCEHDTWWFRKWHNGKYQCEWKVNPEDGKVMDCQRENLWSPLAQLKELATEDLGKRKNNLRITLEKSEKLLGHLREKITIALTEWKQRRLNNDWMNSSTCLDRITGRESQAFERQVNTKLDCIFNLNQNKNQIS